MTTTPKTSPAPTVWPAFRAADAPALIRWLVDVLGFEETLVVRDGDLVAHAELAWPPGGGIMLGSVRDDGDWHAQTAGAYLVTDDVEAVWARVQAAGADVLRPLQSPPYGGQEFSVRDPEGNSWSVGSYPGAPRA
ncbi:VOC family protein [Blastococcus xanthinilyticus]|uniref:Putative glyoxalase superfamily protein PhnB n=1 Tax=Blastococcus xanthinilyticus TaxID=1564164 RepID=A0A5S5CP93_9ACTN|nr:VOC family protein [Blastococcus xanthinilyticus]TYP81336.1 putative glyoxalase superfamily protein PhnB [Blastococcus xanthinilyticus]